MATESNIVNVNSLPEIFNISNGSKIVVFNDTETYVIDWENFPALKQDESGNVTLDGGLTASNIDVTSVNTGNLSADAIVVQGIGGVNASNDFYNSFTIVEGILTTAAYITGSPEFNYINEVTLPELSTTLTTNYTSAVDALSAAIDGFTKFDETGTCELSSGVNTSITFAGVPADVVSNILVTDFIIASNKVLSYFPKTTVTTLTPTSVSLTIEIGAAPASTIIFTIRLLKFY